MRFRALGRRGPTTSALGVSVPAPIPGDGRAVEDADVAAALTAAVDAGITFVDTADPRGTGHCERLVRTVLSRRRDRIVLGTAFGGRRSATGTVIPGQGRPEQCARALDAGLARLGTDHVDLHCLLDEDPTTPIEETVDALGRFVRAGKIRHIGLPALPAETIRRAHRVHPITAVHAEYSLFDRAAERTVLPVCRELGIGFLARPRAADPLRGTRAPHRDLVEFAHELGCTTGQLALAWLLHRDVLPLVPALDLEDVRFLARTPQLRVEPEVLHRLDALHDPAA
ncbi:aldo/keto reductase [Saccharopolyspora rosea]|uniref:Aldo/keto reductase n=1 Tax=Saccharopolyspora rosea TaxID=524884 RepID=A0ABW3FZ24_9PSEU|nr:aldo/keto reductase [Saccharopolyspora rosea]